jgi:DNA-binding transcriptional regulator YhcF (GntR family)
MSGPSQLDGPGPPAPLLRVDLTSPTPPYEQLREQFAGLIATQNLHPGDRLPPVRQLAADLGLAPGTVAHAYRQLEHAGLVEGHGRNGTRIRAGTAPTTGQPSHQHALAQAATQFAATARKLGIDDATALASLRNALAGAHLREGTAAVNRS